MQRKPLSDVPAQEYVTSVMQVLSLPPTVQDQLSEAAPAAETVSRGDLSRIMLFMAPDRFVLNAWRHFTQRDDPCEFATGRALLDRERF